MNRPKYIAVMSLKEKHASPLATLWMGLLGLSLVTGWAAHADPQGTTRLAGWQNLSQDWEETLSGIDSRLVEGDLVNLRCVVSLPSGGSKTVNLKYDFTTGNGSTRFFDYLASPALPNSTLLSGTGVSGNPAEDHVIPRDTGIPVQPAGSVRVWGATITGFGPYALVNGVKVLPTHPPITISLATDRYVRAVGGRWLCTYRRFEHLFEGGAPITNPKLDDDKA